MKYIVFLRSCGNIDNNECPYEEIVPPRFEHAESIDECGRKVRNYIEDNCLGSGQWCGGQVYQEKVGYIGRCSYNGRFWGKDTEYGREWLSMGTLIKEIESVPDRIRTIKLYRITGEWLATLSPKEAIEQYGSWDYSCGYSDLFDTISIWIY